MWNFGLYYAVIGIAGIVAASDFQPLSIPNKQGDSESRTGMWFRPDLGKAEDVLPLKTRVWATKDSVTGGVAMKISFAKGSTGKLAWELDPKGFLSGSAGLTFFAKASHALKLTVHNLPVDVGTDWKKSDLPWDRLGTTKEAPKLGWQLVVVLAEPAADNGWLILDRIGSEGPAFDANPKIEKQTGPDATISTKDLLHGAGNLAKTLARLKSKQPFKVIALGDSVTAGSQMQRGTWGVDGPAGVPFLYFSHTARLWEEQFGYKGITPVQHGHSGWTAQQGLSVVDQEVVAEAADTDLVILAFGANDMGWANKKPADWKADVKKLIDRVKTKTDQILVLSPTVGGKVPVHAEEITKTLKEIVTEEKVAGADITKLSLYRGEAFAWALLANGYHPDYMGHLTMAEFIAPLLTGKERTYPE